MPENNQLIKLIPQHMASRVFAAAGMAGMEGAPASGENALRTLQLQLGVPDDRPLDLLQILAVCAEHGLNPLTKEIYGFNQKGKWVPIVGIDGWMKIANKHAQFQGIEYDFKHNVEGKLVSVQARLFRKDRPLPVVVEEYLEENIMPTEPWKKRPHRMLRHRATCQVIREAFGIGGVYHDVDPESMVIDAEIIEKPRPSSAAAAKLAAQANGTPAQIETAVATQAPATEPKPVTAKSNGAAPTPLEVAKAAYLRDGKIPPSIASRLSDEDMREVTSQPVTEPAPSDSDPDDDGQQGSIADFGQEGSPLYR